jgi:hypothetical protein
VTPKGRGKKKEGNTMAGNEIKKAFDTMKRGLAKEIGISNGYYCKAKQIENRTATLLVCNDTPYEKEIEREQAEDKRVQSFDTWTEAQKARSHARSIEDITRYQQKLAKYQTKENELMTVKEELSKSKAFKTFSANFERVTLTTEAANGCYYIRFNY